MNTRLNQISSLISLLREIETAIPSAASAPKDIGQSWVDALPRSNSAKLFWWDGRHHLEGFEALAHPLGEDAGILVIGLATLRDEAPGLVLGTCPALETAWDFEAFLQPQDGRHSILLATPEDDPGKIRTAFCWGTDDAESGTEKRGYRDGTVIPFALRCAFDLPERVARDMAPPERRMATDTLVRCCQAWIRELFGT